MLRQVAGPSLRDFAKGMPAMGVPAELTGLAAEIWLDKARENGLIPDANGRIVNKAANPSVPQVQVSTPPVPQMNQTYVDWGGLVSADAFPLVTSEVVAAQYATWDRQNLKRLKPGSMPDGSGPVRGQMKLSKHPFNTQFLGLGMEIGEMSLANAYGGIDQIGEAYGEIGQSLRHGLEGEFKTAFMADSGQWEKYEAPSKKWDLVTGDEDNTVKDLQDARRYLRRIRPSSRDIIAIMDSKVWDTLGRQKAFRGEGASEIPIVSPGRFFQQTRIDRVYIGEAGDEDDEPYLGTNVLVCVAPRRKTLGVPSAGARIAWTGFDNVAPNGIGGRVTADPKNYHIAVDGFLSWAFVIQSKELGYMITNVID